MQVVLSENFHTHVGHLCFKIHHTLHCVVMLGWGTESERLVGREREPGTGLPAHTRELLPPAVLRGGTRTALPTADQV